MAWRLSTPLPVPAKALHTHHHPYSSLDSFKASPLKSRRPCRGIWAGPRPAHASCRNGKDGKSLLHVQYKGSKFSRWQWPCTLPTSKQTKFNVLLQSLKSRESLLVRQAHTAPPSLHSRSEETWAAYFLTKPGNSLTKRFSSTQNTSY